MTAATLQERLDAAPVIDIWPNPEPLPGGLLPVPAFDLDMLPAAFKPWIGDAAERMQVPAEFIAIPAMLAAGAVIGNKVAIRPMQRDDWQEVPNLWGCIVGRPGVLKSPSVSAALGPLRRLEVAANERYQGDIKLWQASELERSIRKDARKEAMRKALKADPSANVSHLACDDEEAPTCRRYSSNDSSYQALGELLRQNPTGLLVHRDELMSLLAALDREDNSEARGFYLTGWNGADSYVFDRIGRGMNLLVPHVTVSVLGSTQPGKISEYVRRVVSGIGDDGLLQRFSMAVWPDMSPDWQEHDRYPDSQYKQAAFDAFQHLDRLDAVGVNAETDQFAKGDGRGFLRFCPEAQEIFRDWRRGLELRLRSDELHPALESHISKYRKLVPSLALIHHLANRGAGAVDDASLLAALAWAEFLEAHAHRIYQSATAGELDGAKVILRALRQGRLEGTFTTRDVVRRSWAPMGRDVPKVQAAIDLLADYHWLRAEAVETGGRPSTLYRVNPKGLAR